MLRVVAIALMLAACGQPADTPLRRDDGAAVDYPADPLPADFVAHMGPGPNTLDYEAVETLFESAEPVMVRQRRSMTPIIVKIDNLPEDDVVWTVISFNRARGEDTERSLFERRWIARRERKAWDGRSYVDWADSHRCKGFLSALAPIADLRAPAIEPPSSQANNRAKTTVVLQRSFTLWTTWTPAHDLRFSGNAESEIGRWTIKLAIALRPCWTATEPTQP